MLFLHSYYYYYSYYYYDFLRKSAFLWTLTIKKFSKVCCPTIKHYCRKVGVFSSSSSSLQTPDATAPPQSGCVDTPALNCWQNTVSPLTVMKSHFQPPVQPMTSRRRWHHPWRGGEGASAEREKQKGPCCPVGMGCAYYQGQPCGAAAHCDRWQHLAVQVTESVEKRKKKEKKNDFW